MIYVIASILLICHLLGTPEWLISASLAENMFFHHFFHGNIFHLAANLLAGYYAFKGMTAWRFICAYVIASLSILCAIHPTIGFSNIIYALIGLRSPHFRHPWWRHPGTIVFLSVTLIMVFVPNVAAVTHIVSFCGGVLISMISRKVQQVKNDCARYI